MIRALKRYSESEEKEKFSNSKVSLNLKYMQKKKITVIIITIVFLIIFFFLPLIPDTSVFTTASQKEDREVNCSQRGCGAIILITPYEYIEKSFINFISQSK